jgi:hypothetical protein
MSEITPAQKTALLKLPGFNEIRDQYAKEQKMAGAGKRRMKGRGFWGDVYNWFVGAGTTVNDFLKKTKLISNVAGAVLPILAPLGTALLTANPLAAAASVGGAKAIAEGIKSLGYGSKSMHMMPDGSMMKGKMHGGMMMGMGNQPLAINPPDQRMRGVAPKSTMRGAGKMSGGYGSQDVEYIVKAITGRGKKMRGKGEYTTADIDGTPTLSMLQNRKMRSIAGSGYGTDFNTLGVNGVPQVSVAPSNPGIIHNIGGKGMMKVRRPRNMGMGGTEFGSVSSEFGNMRFA